MRTPSKVREEVRREVRKSPETTLRTFPGPYSKVRKSGTSGNSGQKSGDSPTEVRTAGFTIGAGGRTEEVRDAPSRIWDGDFWDWGGVG